MTSTIEKNWFENISACFVDETLQVQPAVLMDNRNRAANMVSDYLQKNIIEALAIFNLRAQKKINFIPHRPENGFSLIRGTRRSKVMFEQDFLQIETSQTQGYEMFITGKELLQLEIDPFGGIEWKMQDFVFISNEHLVKKIFLSILNSDLKEKLK